MASALVLVIAGIALLYMVTTFVMIQDIRDNTREMVELLRDEDGAANTTTDR